MSKRAIPTARLYPTSRPAILPDASFLPHLGQSAQGLLCKFILQTAFISVQGVYEFVGVVERLIPTGKAQHSKGMA
jgi:hypothetical protein